MRPASRPNGEAASANVTKRIQELGDWRGETLAHIRQLIHDADPPDIQEEWKWVSGGKENLASGGQVSVSGGAENKATGQAAWIGGGQKNTTSFSFSSIFGGKELKASAEFGGPDVTYATLTLLNGWKGPASGGRTPAVGVDL